MTSELSFRRLRLLFLVPFAPQLRATHGGGRAIAHLLTNMAARHDVAVMYLRDESGPSIDEAIAEQCARVEEVVRPERTTSVVANLRYRMRLWIGFFQGKPWRVVEYDVREFAQRVEHVTRAWRPDIIQVEYDVMAQYLLAAHGTNRPWIVTIHEPGADAARQRPRPTNTIARLRLNADLISWKRYERKLLRRAPAVVVFTERDRQQLASIPSSGKVVAIPIATSIPDMPLDPRGRSPETIVFVGNFSHRPNVDAALRLCESIHPALLMRFPETILQIVGADPPRELCDQQSNRIEITGWVPDETPYLDRAAVVVAPLRQGGGMRIKVMEALAHGKAMVTSPLAVSGLDVTHGQQLLIADDDAQFTRAVESLLADPDRRVRLAEQARLWALEHLGWQSPVEAYERLYDELLNADQLDRCGDGT